MRTIVPGVRTLVLIGVILASSLQSFSQSITTGNGKFEIGLAVGPLFFLGDLGGHKGIGRNNLKDVNMPLTRLSKGIFVNVYPTEWLGFRVAVNHGVLEGYDNIIKEKGGAEYYRKRRNLQFQSTMFEAHAAIELYPTVMFEQFDGLLGKVRPYGLIGAGIFKFNPKGQYFDPNGTSRWVELKPLRTEGQGLIVGKEEYKLSSLEVPLGAGVKYYFKENKYIGFEICHRKSFTDYVDDVSTDYVDPLVFELLEPELRPMARQLYFREGFQPGTGSTTRIHAVGEQRGDPKDNDSFFSTVIRFGWRLNDKNSPGGRSMRQMRCPAFY
ncbi:MAG TPA: hypothetical protein VEZ55_15770 [Chitinophagaceae bacterium]|nr:hypothetical protein [Chitinophagaceae bacterium]